MPARKIMSLTLILAFLAANVVVASASSRAVTCEAQPNALTRFEGLKLLFAEGQYERFFRKISAGTGVFADGEGGFEAIVESIHSIFPKGFILCETLLSRKLSEKFITEIVVFESTQSLKLFLAWDLIEVDGEWIVAAVEVSDNFSEIVNGRR